LRTTWQATSRSAGTRLPRTLTSVLLLVLMSVLASMLILPWWFNAWEAWSGAGLAAEAAVRCYLGFTYGLALVASALLRWHSWSLGMRRTWLALALVYVLLLWIFGFDATSLRTEKSWIRYPTAGALAAAGCIALLLCARSLRDRAASGWALACFWLVIGAAFLFLGADEVFGYHEALGDKLKRAESLPRMGQNAVTAAYLILAIIALPLLWKFFGRPIQSRYPWLLRGYAYGIAVFGASQIFDLFNKRVLAALRPVGEKLVAAGELPPDLWYVMQRPRLVLNSAEEVLECTAAVLLLVVTLRVWRALTSGEDDETRPQAAARGPWATRAALAAAGSLLTLVALGGSAAFTREPLLGHPAAIESGRIGVGPLPAASAARFSASVELATGASARVDAARRGIWVRTAPGAAEVLVRARRVLGELRGVAPGEAGGLRVLYGEGDDESLLPDLVLAPKLVERGRS